MKASLAAPRADEAEKRKLLSSGFDDDDDDDDDAIPSADDTTAYGQVELGAMGTSNNCNSGLALDDLNWGRHSDINYRVPSFSCKCSEMDMAVCVPPPGCCGYKQVGNLYVCAEGRNAYGEPTIRCAIGACWPMQLVTYFLTLSISGGVFFMTFPLVPWYLCVAAVALLFVNVSALAMTGCGDPGIVARYAKPLGAPGQWEWSEHAQCWYRARPIPIKGNNSPELPFRVQWCNESKILVRDEDHFCPWTGTTIAGGNIRCFYIFVTTICGLLGMVGILGYVAGPSAE